MSPVRLDRSSDLQRLLNEGYEVSATERGHLVVRHVPYVTSRREVAYGDLVSRLVMAGEATASPVAEHWVYWTGEIPCNHDGAPLPNMVNPGVTELEPGIVAQCIFSCKPDSPYPDFHAKMTTYVAMLQGPAQVIDPAATARTYRVVEDGDQDSPFIYPDTASSRAGIVAITDRLRGQRIAIVGLGGTGSYILDFAAKTPVKEIHLFDADDFLSHNAFRAPGAASLDELNTRPQKAVRLASIYSAIKRGVVAHPCAVTASNVGDLRGLDFVFLSMEGGSEKRRIVERLTEWGIPFIDVGMGLKLSGQTLTGIVRVTASIPTKRDHVAERIDFSEPGPDDMYEENIQIADLNALNASLAVIKWKKLNGVYADIERECSMAYTLDGNNLVNEDPAV